MHYPTDNCPNPDGSYPPIAEQEAETIRLFSEYAQHAGSRMTVTHFASLYAKMAEIAATNNLPLVLLETNTASCNGFLGLSDSFLGALWNLDLGLKLASSGFTHAMVHLGGQRSYYNVCYDFRIGDFMLIRLCSALHGPALERDCAVHVGEWGVYVECFQNRLTDDLLRRSWLPSTPSWYRVRPSGLAAQHVLPT